MTRFGMVALLLSLSAMADHVPQISVLVDGKVYVCSGSGGASDPQCIRSLAEYCDAKTSYTGSVCFEKASVACKAAPLGYAPCVRDTADYCDSSTSMTGSQCFDAAVEACRGARNALLDLMRNIAANRK
ncbi:MAG: hypothetical protein HY537_07460 [Deltaproteobacteria bacterium]|nr:hypothetical protein [Deltaproteobacteria bacterium]